MKNMTKWALLLKMCTNNGARATAIMLSSFAASSTWRCPVLTMKQASGIKPLAH